MIAMELPLVKQSIKLALGMAIAGAAQAGDGILFDPDGPGPAAAVTVSVFDWLPSSGLGQGAVPDSSAFTLFTHAKLGQLVDPDSMIIGGTGLNSSYEITLSAGAGEIGVVTGINSTSFFHDPANPVNFFRVYWDANLDSNQLAGTGFNNGMEILSGTIVDVTGNYNLTLDQNTLAPLPPVPLDQFNADDYPGTLTLRGTGGTTIRVQVEYAHPDFFPGDQPGTLIFQSQQNTPFNQTDPSALFTDMAGASVFPSVGAVNAQDGPDLLLQTDASNTFVLAPDEEVLACRVTGGGVDTFNQWDGTTYETGEMNHNGVGNLPPGVDRYTFGGQAGANTALPPQPKGEWTHHQQKGPSGSFSFHAGTASAAAGTEISKIECMDPGFCNPARPAPAKQIDFEGIGNFHNLGNGKNQPVFRIPNATVATGKGNKGYTGTYHWFEVNIDDLGEPGVANKDHIPVCPSIGFGIKGDPTLPADCGCPDFYRITIYNGVYANPDGSITPNKTDVIYEVYGYIDGGNLQIHPLTGFDSK
jgi:hypothetical protein